MASVEPAVIARRSSAGTAMVCALSVVTTPSERGASPAGISHSSGTRPSASGALGTGTSRIAPLAVSSVARYAGVPSSKLSVVTARATGAGVTAGGASRTVFRTASAVAATIAAAAAARQNPTLCQRLPRAPSTEGQPRRRRIPGQTCCGGATGAIPANKPASRLSQAATRAAKAGSASIRVCERRRWAASCTPSAYSAASRSGPGGSEPNSSSDVGSGVFMFRDRRVVASGRAVSSFSRSRAGRRCALPARHMSHRRRRPCG